MRIAFLHSRLRPDGATRVFVELANRFAARGHEVFLVTAERSSELPFELKVPVIEAIFPDVGPYTSAILSVLRMPRIVPPVDAIVSSSVPLAYTAARVVWGRHICGINFVQGDDVSIFDDQSLIGSRFLLSAYRVLARFSYMLPLKVVANSRWSAARYCRYRKMVAPPIINPGVDCEVFRPIDVAKKDIPTIVTVGRKHRAKGLGDLFLALKIVWNTHPFRLVIVTRDKIDIPELEFEVEVVSPRDDRELASKFNAADLFVQASWSEGFGMPPLEAMACGTPVALVNAGGVEDFASDEWNCLLSPPRRPDILARNIERIFNDPGLARNLAEHARITAEKFSWEISVDRLEKILISSIRQYA